ncbi:hypothetical protein BOTCAL_0742g00030 [Botryotinia calthae]|uniref:Uncharacterized protein n=1 Tax=Botryotinia calthae TaxID=38488 RepID=A0A4Y8CGK6_9HELO|nr:hypothetical protein BOTCAL_0742g00030 [Botryotinia calthae]
MFGYIPIINTTAFHNILPLTITNLILRVTLEYITTSTPGPKVLDINSKQKVLDEIFITKEYDDDALLLTNIPSLLIKAGFSVDSPSIRQLSLYE